MTTPTIAIVGGGPGGLTLARLLECKGIDYVVYERDESDNTNRAGGSLDIHGETGQQALKEGGLLDEFKKYARYDDTVFTVADKHGKQHIHMGQDRDAPEIDRSELRQILLHSIPKDKIKWGHALRSATMGDNGKPVLHFGNGTVASGFKLIVGADGAWSKVRPLITKATPQYSGKSYIESRIALDNPLYETTASKTGAGTFISIGSGKLMVNQRQGNGSYRNYFGLTVPEDFFRTTVNLHDLEATRQLLLSDFYADWSEYYKDTIRHATDLRPWQLYSLSTEDMNWTSVPGVALIGDAAHVTLPNGEGVNQAMADALKLASLIAEHGAEKLDQAVQEYEADMFPRAIATIAEGKGMADIMFAEGPEPFVQLMNSFAGERP